MTLAENAACLRHAGRAKRDFFAAGIVVFVKQESDVHSEV